MESLKNNIELPALISDGCVLQRDAKIKLWGKAEPGKELNVVFLGESYKTIVDVNGNWEIGLDHLKPGGPHEIIIECDGNRRLIKDVFIGDVWVLGGQSNMQLPIARTLDLFEDEVKEDDCLEIRKFTVPEYYNFHGPVEELSGGSWVGVNPSSVYEFSAVGYFFAKNIYKKHRIPIGLLQTAIGGTPAEAWISEGTLMRFGRFQELLTLCKDDSYVNGTKQREEMRNNRWYNELYEADEGIQDKIPWFREECDDTSWDEIELPASFRDTPLDIKGCVWLRKEIFVPETMLQGKAKLVLGTIIDGDDTYLNGVKVGNTGYLYPPRRYSIPEGLLKAGKNIIAVRVILNQNIGAFVTDMPYLLKANGEELLLSGVWKYKIGAVTRALPPTTFFQYRPTGVYNGMIYPLRKYGIKGALWYQGESNTEYPYDYKELFESVIKDWRNTWNMGEFPFLYVQLANYCPWKMEPEVSGWARVREEQRNALEVPGTGMAVIIDSGGYNELHPQDKKTVGNRLALWASKLVYGEDLVYSGPIYSSMEKEGDRIKLSFKHIGSGLTAKGGILGTFELCGVDGVFYPATAVIEEDEVVVHSDMVTAPVHVRYAWADNPEGANLYNREGLPASPFTTKC